MKVSKKCAGKNGCGKELLFCHFSPQRVVKNGKEYNYLSSICKDCKAKLEEAKRRQNGISKKSVGYTSEKIKHCKRCGKDKPMKEFYPRSDRNTVKDKCIDCILEIEEEKRRKRGVKSYSDNQKCSSYIGIHIAEDLVGKHAVNLKRMPSGNEGFDFLYKNMYRVDVKASVRIQDKHTDRARGSDRWQFNTNKNIRTDYFLLLAFDNKDDVNLEHVWIVPWYKVRDKKYATIAESTLHKWDKYKSDFILKDLRVHDRAGVGIITV